MRSRSTGRHVSTSPHLAALVAASGLSLAGGPASAETLRDAWASALGDDARLAAAAARVEASNEQWAAARAARLPSLAVDASLTQLDATPAVRAMVPGPFPFDAQFPLQQSRALAYRGTVVVPLYTGGRIDGEGRAAASAAAGAEADVALSTAALRLEVAEGYVAVLRTGRGVRVARAASEALARHLTDATNLANAGAAARADVLAIGVALAEVERRLSSAMTAEIIAQASYNRALSRPLDAPVALEDIGAPESPRPPLATLLQRARDRRPELAELRAESASLAAQASVRRADTQPQVGLVGGYAFQENRSQVHEGLWSVGVAVRWAAFDGGIARREAGALAARARAAERTLDAVKADINLQIVTAQAAVIDAERRVRLSSAAIVSAEESLRVASDRYVTGVGAAVEALDAITRWTGAQQDRDAAEYDVAIGALRLACASGEL